MFSEFLKIEKILTETVKNVIQKLITICRLKDSGEKETERKTATVTRRDIVVGR